MDWWANCLLQVHGNFSVYMCACYTDKLTGQTVHIMVLTMPGLGILNASEWAGCLATKV